MSKKPKKPKKKKGPSGIRRPSSLLTAAMRERIAQYDLHQKVFLWLLMTGLLPDVELFNAVRRSDAEKSLAARAKRLLELEIGPVASALAWSADHLECPTVIPGYVMLCRERLLPVSDDDESRAPGAFVLVPLDIWGIDFTDGGVRVLKEVLDNANKEPGPEGPYSLALWVTGYFNGDGVVISLALDAAGQSIGFFSLHKIHNAVPVPLMAEAITYVMRTNIGNIASWQRMARSYTGPDVSLRPSADRYLVALTEAREQICDLASQVDELSDELDEVEVDFSSAEQEIIEGLRAEIDEIRDAHRVALEAQRAQAAETLAQQASTSRQSALALTTQVTELKKKVADLQRDMEAARVSHERELATARAEHHLDEASTHWRESSEHQAVILRELRLALSHALAARGADGDTARATRTWQLRDIDDWAAENADRVIVLKRASQAAKKSNYENEQLVFEALDLIATTYRDVKLGVADRMAYKEGCMRLGLDFGGSISEAPTDDYFFDWDGRRVFIEQGLGRGNSRDPRYCLRIYFTWLESEQKVVIGWLPSHLPTRMT